MYVASNAGLELFPVGFFMYFMEDGVFIALVIIVKKMGIWSEAVTGPGSKL